MQPRLVVQQLRQLVGQLRLARVKVRLQMELGSVSQAHSSARLHLAVHQQMEASARIGKQRSAKREAVDRAAHPQPHHRLPCCGLQLRQSERHAGDGPAQRTASLLQHRLKTLCTVRHRCLPTHYRTSATFR